MNLDVLDNFATVKLNVAILKNIIFVFLTRAIKQQHYLFNAVTAFHVGYSEKHCKTAGRSLCIILSVLAITE